MRQRKSLVRCGFPPLSIKVKKSQSLIPPLTHSPPCHWSILSCNGREACALICSLELMGLGPSVGYTEPPSPTVPLTHLRGLTAEAKTAGS